MHFNFFFSENLAANDLFIYIEDEIKFSERLRANFGIHMGLFSIRDENYFKIQPRFSGRYMMNENWSIKCSYAEMQQNLHLLLETP